MVPLYEVRRRTTAQRVRRGLLLAALCAGIGIGFYNLMQGAAEQQYACTLEAKAVTP